MSGRVVIMRAGRIEQVGTAEELHTQPRTEFAASFLGKSNFLHRAGRVWSVRPERIDVLAKGAGRLQGRVQSVSDFGPVLKYRIETDEHGVLEVDIDAWRRGAALPPGSDVGLDWKEEAAVSLQG